MSKETAIANLESQVSETKSSLESALADIQEKQAKLGELEQAKATIEQQLEEVQGRLETLRNERATDDSAALLESVKAEVYRFVTLRAVRVLTRFRWNLAARVERTPPIRASICRNPSITDHLSGIRNRLQQVRTRGSACL